MENGDRMSRSQEDLHRKVQEATEKLDAWPEKLLSFQEQQPGSALCAICYLADKDPHPPHVLIVLCPTSPSAVLTFYRAQDGYLVPAEKLMTDQTAIRATIDGVIDLMTTGDTLLSDGAAWSFECLLCNTTGDALGTGGEPRRLNVLLRMQEHVMEAHGITSQEMARVKRAEELESVMEFTLPNGTPLFKATRK